MLVSLASVLHPVFFYCWAVTGVLPSFPTRRSSDLEIVFRCAASPRGAATPASARCPAGTRSHRSDFRGTRSEEHTSELQSHSDLVCRLLLEKKKDRALEMYNQSASRQ